MSLPTVEKTWLYKVNQSLVTTGTIRGDFAQLLFAIKQSLTQASGWTTRAGAGTTHPAPWVVTQSSKQSSAGASDLWASAADLHWADPANAHSWCCMRNGGNLGNEGGTNPVELILDCLAYNDSYAYIGAMTIGWRGYNSNGTTTARPTLNSSITGNVECVLMAGSGTGGSRWMGNVAGTFNAVLHVMMTDDGLHTRIIVTRGTDVAHLLVIEGVRNPVGTTAVAGRAWWSAPAIAALNTQDPPSLVPAFTDNAWTCLRLRDCVGNWRDARAYASTIMYGSNSYLENLQVPNDLTGEYPLAPIGFVCSQAGAVGRIAEWKDAWFGMTNVPTGDMYPEDGTKQFAHFNSLVVPWNGTTMVVTP